MKDNVEVKGELDAGWTSYYDSNEHGHMSETIDGTTDDDKGKELTDILPSDIDPDDLTDQQQTVLEAAISNPYQAATDIDKIVGSKNYTYQVLQNKAPEFYENVFKKRGTSPKGGYTESELNRESESDDSDEERTEEDIETNVESAQTGAESIQTEQPTDALETALDAIEATAQTEETKQAIEHLRRLL
jgi:hypothetical protein